MLIQTPIFQLDWCLPWTLIVIEMDQSTDLQELSFKLKLANISHLDVHSVFNFSEVSALYIIQEYIDSMYTLHEPTTIALICLYVPIFMASLLGNALVLLAVMRNPQKRQVNTICIMNLALTDLAVTVTCIPLVIGQTIYRVWVYSRFMCKFTGYIQGNCIHL